MKRVVFFLLLFTSFICCFAQESFKDTLSEPKFSNEQRVEWDSIERIWTQKYFNPFLKKNKINVSCSGCERVIFMVFFEIDKEGSCKPTILWSKKCGSDFTKKQKEDLRKLLILFKFPPPFYNYHIKTGMGRALKC